jgi:hypothetical protein
VTVVDLTLLRAVVVAARRAYVDNNDERLDAALYHDWMAAKERYQIAIETAKRGDA